MKNKKFRKRPITVEAFQWTIDKVPDWWKELKDITMEAQSGTAYVPTEHGSLKISSGNYVIRDSNGTISTCNPEIFRLSYMEVEGDIEDGEVIFELHKSEEGTISSRWHNNAEVEIVGGLTLAIDSIKIRRREK